MRAGTGTSSAVAKTGSTRIGRGAWAAACHPSRPARRCHDLLEPAGRGGAEPEEGHPSRALAVSCTSSPYPSRRHSTSAHAGALAHRLNADLDPPAAALGALLEALERSVKEPSSMYHTARASGERLEVVPAQVLLTVAEVDRPAQLVQLRQRGEVGEDRAPAVDRRGNARCCPAARPSSRGRPAWRAPWPRRNRTPARSRRLGERLPSPISEPRTTCHCCSRGAAARRA